MHNHRNLPPLPFTSLPHTHIYTHAHTHRRAARKKRSKAKAKAKAKATAAQKKHLKGRFRKYRVIINAQPLAERLAAKEAPYVWARVYWLVAIVVILALGMVFGGRVS